MGITPRMLTTQDITRLVDNTKAMACLEQPVTPVTVQWKPLSKLRCISTAEEVADVCYRVMCAVDEFYSEVGVTFRFYGFPPNEVLGYHTSLFLSLLYQGITEHPLNDACSAFLGSRFAIQSILTRESLTGFMRRWERNLRWDRSRPYTPQQYLEECYKMREEAYELLTRICKEHGAHAPVNLEKKEPFRSIPTYRAVPGIFG